MLHAASSRVITRSTRAPRRHKPCAAPATHSGQMPCPGELLPENGMFASSFSVAFHLPPVQLHKGLFLRLLSPPRAQAMLLRGKEPPVALRLPRTQRESQNYRIVRFGRNLWRSSSLTPHQGRVTGCAGMCPGRF